MKRIIPGIRNLGDRANALGDAAKSAARRMEEFRQTMVSTTSQLESLKTEMPLCVADLRTDREDRLSAAMLEIEDADDLFEEAGYAIDGIDLEISPAQRLILHLFQTRRVESDEIERLKQSQPPGTLRAVLSALIRARETAATMAPGGLPDYRVVIGLGPIPSVRLSWRNERRAIPLPATQARPTDFAAATAGGFFSQPVAITTTARPPETGPGEDETASEEAAPPIQEAPAPISHNAMRPEATHLMESKSTTQTDPADPLARFKKMPDFSR